jgi:hypothetical protein
VTFNPDLPGNRTVKSVKIFGINRGDQGLSNDVPAKSIEQGPILHYESAVSFSIALKMEHILKLKAKSFHESKKLP